MKHYYARPDQQLSEYVRTVLVLEEHSINDPKNNSPIVTNGSAALVCRTEKQGANRVVQVTLFGKSIPAEALQAEKATCIIIYFFYPFVLPSLFNLSASRLIKTPLPLSNWNAHKNNAVVTQLFGATAAREKIDICDHLLIQQLKENKSACDVIRYTTDRIMQNPGKEILSVIQKELELTERTFQRIFKRYVGITPNNYRRICQFQLSFSQVREGRFDTLADIAYDNGFVDQSHFIRSFKEFAKTTPYTFLRKGLNPK